jgi:uncharacterized repeat protein (TIGR01451 family)
MRGSVSRRPRRPLLLPTLALALLAAPAALAQEPPLFSKSFSPGTIGVGSTATLTFVIDNVEGDSPVVDLAFVDTLPSGLTLADPAFATTDCGFGVLDAPDGGTTITLAGGGVAAFSTCTVEVDVTGTEVGEYENVSGDLTSNAGNSGPATDALAIAFDRPGFTKAFDPPVVQLGGTSTLTFTIDNGGGGQTVNLTFSDTLPSGLEIANPPLATNTCGGILTAPAGGSTIELLLGSVDAESVCTISVAVTATGGGRLENRSGNLTGVTFQPTTSVNSGHANAALEVTVEPLALVKEVLGNPVPPGGTATIRFTLFNFDRADSATDLSFSDDLDAALSGLAASAPLPIAPCGPGSTLTGTSVITLAGGEIAPAASCTFDVVVEVPADAVPGLYPNTTSEVTGEVAGAPVVSSPASDTLEVAPIPLLGKEFTDDPVGAGSSVTLEFTVANTSPDFAATGITFTDILSTFLPFPFDVTLPSEPCGAGSSMTVVDFGVDGQGIRLDNGSLAPLATCTFHVTVGIPDGFPGGTYLNTTRTISATVDGETVVGPAASDQLVVRGAPRLFKEFTDDPVQPGDTVTLEFTLTHDENAAGNAVDITFTDDLEAALSGLVATGLPLADPCGAGSELTGTSLLTLTGGTLAPGGSCTFQVTLQVPADAAPGPHTNTTGAVTATVAGEPVVGNGASGDLLVGGLELTKEFLDDPVIPGGTVTLRFTIENVTAATTFDSIFFQDDLDEVLDGLAATGLPLVDPCGAGSSLVGSAGNTFLTFVGGTLGPGADCQFDVTLQVPPGAVSNTYANTTANFRGEIEGDDTVIPFPNASDLLVVDDLLIDLDKEFLDDPVAPGDTVTLRFTVTNLDDEPLTDVTFTDDLDAALTGLVAVGLPLADPCGAGSELTGTSLLTLTGASLAANGSCFFDVTLQVPAEIAPGEDGFNVTSEASGTIGGLPVSGAPASDTLAVAAVTFGKAFSGPVVPGGTVTLGFTIENTTAVALVSLGFVDDLGAVLPGLVAVDTPLANPCGAGSSLTGTGVLTLSGGALGPGDTCSFDVTLAVPADAAGGVYPNSTSALSEAGLEVAPPATDDLVVQPLPTVAKAFAPDAIDFGGTTSVSIVIDNTAGPLPATGVGFVDTLPAGMTVADPANAATDCTGGTLTAVPGASSVSYSGGTVAAGAVCAVAFDVVVAASGTVVNSVEVTTALGAAAPAAAEVEVAAAPFEIPTASEWGLGLLAALLAAGALWRLRS